MRYAPLLVLVLSLGGCMATGEVLEKNGRWRLYDASTATRPSHVTYAIWAGRIVPGMTLDEVRGITKKPKGWKMRYQLLVDGRQGEYWEPQGGRWFGTDQIIDGIVTVNGVVTAIESTHSY